MLNKSNSSAKKYFKIVYPASNRIINSQDKQKMLSISINNRVLVSCSEGMRAIGGRAIGGGRGGGVAAGLPNKTDVFFFKLLYLESPN